jgi:hypothetical protein
VATTLYQEEGRREGKVTRGPADASRYSDRLQQQICNPTCKRPLRRSPARSSSCAASSKWGMDVTISPSSSFCIRCCKLKILPPPAAFLGDSLSFAQHCRQPSPPPRLLSTSPPLLLLPCPRVPTSTHPTLLPRSTRAPPWGPTAAPKDRPGRRALRPRTAPVAAPKDRPGRRAQGPPRPPAQAAVPVGRRAGRVGRGVHLLRNRRQRRIQHQVRRRSSADPVDGGSRLPFLLSVSASPLSLV